MNTKSELVNELLENTENTIRTCLFELRMSKNSLVSHNFIVEIGAYTIAKNEDKTVKLSSSKTPTRWTKEGVKEILNVPFKNHLNELIKPTVYNYKEWYKRELQTAWSFRKDILSRI